jgi:DNA invertase Pin-like site-specific DNA recombinase
MALIGLVRVSTDKQKTRRQHDALDPICLKVFEEKISGKLNVSIRKSGDGVSRPRGRVRGDALACGA